MKIVLAVDFSKFSEEAARQVSERLWPSGTEVCVLSIVEDLTAKLIRESESEVISIAELLNSRNIRTTTIVELGDPPSRIVGYAKEWGADFIFVGSHGHTALTRFLFGSVSRYVVHRAACSVCVVRAPIVDRDPSGSAGLRVLFATDASEGSVAAAHSIASRPWPAGSRVLVASATGRRLQSRPSLDTGQNLGDHDARVLAAQEAVDFACQMLLGTGLEIERIVLEGDARAMILDHARQWPADLIVVGSHGKRGFDHLLLGSVSETVAAHAHCSVEVIRSRSSET